MRKTPARKRLVPYWLLLPGLLWLVVFFAAPLVYQASTSVQTGSLEEGFKVTWHFADVLGRAGRLLAAVRPLRAATPPPPPRCACSLGYPLAYLIAFKAGRWRNLVMVLVIAPFFTSFLIRTLAWKTILADGGPVVGVLNSPARPGRHQLAGPGPKGSRVLATPLAVVCGLTYNFLPFMVLPLYTSLERIDPRLHEAAGDLYARPATTFRRVTLPLSMPGVVAGTLLTFIPAAGDYINAELLGSTDTEDGRQRHPVPVPAGPGLPDGRRPLLHPHGGHPAMVTIYIRKSGTEDLV